MQRKSWNAIRLDRLKAQLAKAGNTPDAFNAMMEFEELLPLEAQELSEQVRWPNPPKVFSPELMAKTADQLKAAAEGVSKAAPPAMVVKRFDPPAAPPKIVIKRY